MVDVLVVGAGPVGLTAAHELARRGVAVRVVDRAPGPARSGRATANHARTLEVYHQMGVVDRVLAESNEVSRFSVHRGGRNVLRLGSDYRELPTRYPFTAQVDQCAVEAVLRDRLHGFGVPVEWSTGVTGLEQGADGVTVLLNGERRVTVPWVVGADGGHSTVRGLLGVPMEGTSTEVWLAADTALDVDLARDSVHLLATAEGALLVVPVGGPGRWRLVDTAPRVPDLAASVAARVTRATGRQVTRAELSWVSEFTVQQRMAGRLRDGRCFLVGDAAHVHSPASGQGMCTGVQDAANLAWKLADVVRGHADPALLDTYEAERQPVHRRLLTSTRSAAELAVDVHGVAAVKRWIGAQVLKALPPARHRVERGVHRGISGLALSYEDSPLTEAAPCPKGFAPGQRVACDADTEALNPEWRELVRHATDPRWTLVAYADAVPDVEARFGAAVAVLTASAELPRAFGLRPGDYALIRPDGYLAGKGALADDMAVGLRRFHLRPHESRVPVGGA